MKIKLQTSIAGDRISHAPGEVIEREEAEARRMIEAGHAVALEDEDKKKK